jgi:hypothetical protein
MFDGGFDDGGGASSSGSSRVIGVVEVIVRNALIAFQGEVSFGKEHNVNVATGKKRLQFECMLRKAIGIP